MKCFRFDVRLLHVTPPPRREFLIARSATFADLHEAIQDACGWENAHLFSFHVEPEGPVLAGLPDPEEGDTEPDAADVGLASFFSGFGRDRCYYQYDFGDSWWHEVRLLETIEARGRSRRRLLGGALAFPPEDCGGITGYEQCVALVLGRDFEFFHDPDELREWLGDWHPERFDLDLARKRFDR